jgi:hypothetical protein
MGLTDRPHPLTPAEQIERWRAEGETLQTLLVKIRTPAIRKELQRQLALQAKEALAPKAGVTNAAVIAGGG